MRPKFGISPLQSVRVRVLILVVISVMAATSLLSWYTLRQLEAATTFELEQEGLLLSNALEASILPAVAAGDIPAVQRHIDRLVAIREQNDIEINIMLLDGSTSAVVASNDLDNIEETSSEEHANLLASLAYSRPIVFIGRDETDTSQEEEEEDEPPPSPADPDYYLPDGQRFLSVTSPLIVNNRGVGSINTKLSLARIDQELAATRTALQIAAVLELLVLAGGLVLLLNVQVFSPLQRMARKMQFIARGDLNQRIAHTGPANEIGWLAQTFDQMLDKLQAAFDREKRFTADVSHELRTPLTALKGHIGVTLTKPRAVIEYEETLKLLENEVDRLARLSNDLLFLSRLEQGQLQPNFDELHLSDLLGAIVDQMQPLAAEKKVQLKAQIPAGMTIQGDPDYLIRLFINLLDNAIKYTPPGGEVRVQVEQNDRDALTSVSDTGPGIPPQHLSFLFDRFYRVQADRSRNSGGAGLGLAIAYEIAGLHHGGITVQSEREQGTTFTVRLPLGNCN